MGAPAFFYSEIGGTLLVFAPQLGVELVSQSVAEQVYRHSDEEESNTREEDNPGS